MSLIQHVFHLSAVGTGLVGKRLSAHVNPLLHPLFRAPNLFFYWEITVVVKVIAVAIFHLPLQPPLIGRLLNVVLLVVAVS